MQRTKAPPVEPLAEQQPNPNTLRVRKHRDSLRDRGMRPLQIWVPDTANPHFALECKRQSTLANNDNHWHEIIPNLTDPKL
jgi:hypothetical protein